jgi:PAS domain S-box-containing protein
MGAENVDLDRVVHGTFFGEATLNASVAALVADEQGVYIAANDEACRLTGYAREQLAGIRMGGLAADDASRQLFAQIMRGTNLQGRKEVRRRDGGNTTCRYWAIPTQVARLPYYLLLLWPLASTGN